MSEANVDVSAPSVRAGVPGYSVPRRERSANLAAYLRDAPFAAQAYAAKPTTIASYGGPAPSLPAPPLPVPSGAYAAVGKRAIDITLIVLAAPVALLLIGISALLLWFEGGSPFYRQARLGKGGDHFQILKLRTMVREADRMLEACLAADPAMREEWDRTQKLRHDPRITRIGAFLRKTSLDELPQLWNVLRGEMSLVGPRPMLPEQLALYGDASHYFALRPGVTGYWQVSQRNESTFRARTALDIAYLYDISLIEDAKVLWRTVGAVVKRTGV